MILVYLGYVAVAASPCRSDVLIVGVESRGSVEWAHVVVVHALAASVMGSKTQVAMF